MDQLERVSGGTDLVEEMGEAAPAHHHRGDPASRCVMPFLLRASDGSADRSNEAALREGRLVEVGNEAGEEGEEGLTSCSAEYLKIP